MYQTKLLVLLITCTLIFSPICTAVAQTNPPYAIDWWTVSGGGSRSGGSYALNGTIGQPNTGVFQGGPYSLTSGFWAGTDNTSTVYLPTIMRE